MRGGVIRLLALRVPAPDRYVLEHLNTEEAHLQPEPARFRLGTDRRLCAEAAVDKLTPAEVPWDSAVL